jgi:hypothetical protein
VAVLFILPTSSNDSTLGVFLRQETGKILMEQCEGSFVVDAPAECGVWPTSAAQVGPSPRVCGELKLKIPPFLGHYSQLHRADISLLLNKNSGSTLYSPVTGHGTFET